MSVLEPTVLGFVNKHKLRFQVIETSWNEIRRRKEFKGIECQKTRDIFPEGWKWEQDASHKDCVSYFKSKVRKAKFSNLDFNQAMIIVDKFLVIDTDEEEQYKLLVDLLHEDLNPKAVTESFRGRANNIYYKRHFWFKIPKGHEEAYEHHRGPHQMGGWDYFYGNTKVCEYLDVKLDEEHFMCLPIERFHDMIDEMKRAFPVREDFKKTKQIKQIKTNDSMDTDEDPITDDKPTKKSTSDKKGKTEPLVNSGNKISDENLITVLDALHLDRWSQYAHWSKLAWIFHNEKLDMKLFHKYSAKASDKYNKKAVDEFLKRIRRNDGYTIGTLYAMLKEDNLEVFKQQQQFRADFWNTIGSDQNDADWAKLFFSSEPEKYIYTSSGVWYEYNQCNILKRCTTAFPISLPNLINKRLTECILEQRNLIDLGDKHAQDKYKIVQRAYVHLGKAKTIKDIIFFLKSYYHVEDIEEKIDANTNLLCFSDKLFDITIKDFRDVKPTDYCYFNTKYEAPTKSNEKIRKEIDALLWSIFENQEMIDYYMTMNALSLFTAKLESMFILTGNGRNGKGVLSTIMKHCLGDYMYEPNSSFLSTRFSADVPSPSVANTKGRRQLNISEPQQDNTRSTEINNEFLKKMTGRDSLNARFLNENNFVFTPVFTVFLQCNQIPSLKKPEFAIAERLKIIPFKFEFVDNPTKPNQRKKDYDLKDKTSNAEFTKQFMFMLLEYAIKYVDVDVAKINIPKSVTDNTDDYMDDNNPIKGWLLEHYELTNNPKDKVKTMDVLKRYNESVSPDSRLTSQELAGHMMFNGISIVKSGVKYFSGIKEKIIPEKENEEYQFQDDDGDQDKPTRLDIDKL